MSSQPHTECSPVPRRRPLLFINYNHPSDRHLPANRKSVSSFLSSAYRRHCYKTFGPTKPLPLGFFGPSQQADSTNQQAAHTEAEVEEETTFLDHSKLTDVSGGFQMDPFDALPVKGARAVSLAMRYFTGIFSRSSTTPPGSMESDLSAQAFQHTDLFSALVAYAHIHYRTNVGKELTQSKDIVYYHGLSLSSLRNRLIGSTDYLDLSIISSTLILLFIAIYAADTRAFLTHLCGLRQEVAIYRDRQGSILTHDFIIHINYMEYIGVAIRGPSSPDVARLALETGKVFLASNAVSLPVDTLKTHSTSVSKPPKHDLTQLPTGFCKIAQTGKLSWATIDVLDRFCTWVLNSNSIREFEVRYNYHTKRATESASMHKFPFTVTNMEHCLSLSQYPLQEGDNPVECCLCIAIILCARITTMLMDDDLRLRSWGTIVHPGFRQRLAAIMECFPPTVDDIDCLFWITVNTFCPVDPLETRYRAMHALLDNTVKSQTWTWLEVEEIMREFIWYENPNPFWKSSWEERVRLWRARGCTESKRFNT